MPVITLNRKTRAHAGIIPGLLRTVLAVALLSMATYCFAQFNANPTLKIGDPAPPIKVQEWIRGPRIDQFEKGRVYVVDFWATWCGGCIMSFPHINSIAGRYQGKVTFLSVDSYEDAGENKGKDPAPIVREFLKTGAGKGLALDVCVDGPAMVMFNAWIKPLRRPGFPTTFVIDQDGKIAWVDVNLDHLDWVLSRVLAKTWDREKAAAIMKERDAIDDLFFAAVRGKVGDQPKENGAILAACEAFERRFPDRKDAVAFYKFWTCMHVDQTRLPEVLEQMAADPLSRYLNLHDAAGLSLQKNTFSKPTYAAVAKVLERCLKNEHIAPNTGGSPSALYAELADAHDKAGQPAAARSALQKAIEKAIEEKATADAIQQLRHRLQKYDEAPSSAK